MLPNSNSAPSGANTCSSHSSTQLDVGKLKSLVQHYFTKGSAPSTQRTYKSTQEQFCHDEAFTPLPVIQSLLCVYVSYLVDQNLKHGTLKVHL